MHAGWVGNLGTELRKSFVSFSVALEQLLGLDNTPLLWIPSCLKRKQDTVLFVPTTLPQASCGDLPAAKQEEPHPLPPP